MFGNSFFTRSYEMTELEEKHTFSSPCLGILFHKKSRITWSMTGTVFVPMFGDSFFTLPYKTIKEWFINGFRPHVWGFFFHQIRIEIIVTCIDAVFVPMFGDLFFTRCMRMMCLIMNTGFRPHVWGFFFHYLNATVWTHDAPFSSPCLGILFLHVWAKIIKNRLKGFRPHVWGFFFHTSNDWRLQGFFPLFSSPCLGILFSQQARESPRSGLSIALLRRGFPIDWNSHYFHPLTYCFLRFHAYRRGFLFL